MEKLKAADKTLYVKLMRHLFTEYGTGLHCNRFPIGNCNEYAIADVVRSTGLQITEMQNAVRIDQSVEGVGRYGIKYSSSGDIKLHNSNNVSNTDMTMHDTLLVTPTEWWYLRESEMRAVNVDVKPYLKNTGDGLSLNRSILTALRTSHYPHFFPFDISIDKKVCKNKEIARVLYDAILKDLELQASA